jgi:AraC family transcriptional regulator of arabinose operon
MNANRFRVLTEVDYKLPLYVTSAGGWDNQDRMDRPKGFKDYQWIQTLEGTGVLELGGETYTVGKGQGMLLYPHESHLYYPLSEPWEVRWVSFNGQHAGDMLISLGLERSEVLFISNPDTTLKMMYEIASVLQIGGLLEAVESSALLYQVLMDLFLYTSSSEIRSKHQHFEQMAPAIAYIENHYHESISLQQLADQLSVSPQHTCLLFRDSLGLRPIEYINRYRLRKAKELLLLPHNIEVREVGERVGYAHTSYFIKLFKQQEGVTPSGFRRIHRDL